MSLVKRSHKALRRMWMKYAMRGVAAADNYSRLDLAYKIADPWNMNSDLERYRFERTNAIIAKHFPSARSILEVGCGEGHQSEYLQKVCPEVYGVDVSETAIERAKQRVPGAQFAAADIFSQPWGNEPGRFDLVVACEVLYYVADMQRTIDEMNKLGKSCLVTIFAPAIGRVGPLLEKIPDATKDWFGTRHTQWVVTHWRGSSQ
jgi:2-polyprenyl-3-methyl-5-hydroxy-6-metoxy-1,4-benzoquinol methylase